MQEFSDVSAYLDQKYLSGFPDLPPAIPANLQASSGDSVVDLSTFDAVADTEGDLAGYNIYRSELPSVTATPGNLLASIGTDPAPSYSDTTAINGTTYYYVVTSEDDGGQESGTSDEVMATPNEDTAPPSQVILTPTSGQAVVSHRPTFRERHPMTSALPAVTVAIYDIAQGLWWDGATWVAPVTRVPATVVGTGTDVTWSYSFAPGINGSFWWAAQATDTSGKFASQSSSLFSISDDGVPPSQIIDSPTPGQVVGAPANLSGTASDNLGVGGVTVAIYDITQGLWWDGATWVAPVTRVAASITGNGTLEAWSYSFDPGITGDFWWAAQATDTSGNVASQSSSTFTISGDAGAPTQVIVTPGVDQIVSAPADLSGTAEDDTSVAGVTVAIFDIAQGLWWDGATWVAPVTRVPATVVGAGTDVTWSYSFAPGISGSFWWAAQATDGVGNVAEQSTSTFGISGDPIPPTQIIDNPTPGASVTAPVSMSGTASDNIGVGGVTVAIYDITQGLWWDGAIWVAPVTRVAATTSGNGILEAWSYAFNPGITGDFWWAVREHGHLRQRLGPDRFDVHDPR